MKTKEIKYHLLFMTLIKDIHDEYGMVKVICLRVPKWWNWCGFGWSLEDIMHDVEDNFIEWLDCSTWNLKVKNQQSNKRFHGFICEVLEDIFLKGNELPNHTYGAKKILCLIDMKHKKIYVCPNDCIVPKGV